MKTMMTMNRWQNKQRGERLGGSSIALID